MHKLILRLWKKVISPVFLIFLWGVFMEKFFQTQTNYSLIHLLILFLNLNTSFSTAGYSAVHWIGSWMAGWSMSAFSMGENSLWRKPCYIIVCALNTLLLLFFFLFQYTRFSFIDDLIGMTFFRDLSDINLRSVSPTFGDLLDLKIL